MKALRIDCAVGPETLVIEDVAELAVASKRCASPCVAVALTIPCAAKSSG
jgi:hypothetical protein